MNETDLSRAVLQMQITLSEIQTAQRVAADQQRRITSDVETVRRIITGESEPERGLVLRMRNVEQHVEQIRNDYSAVRNWAWYAIGAALVSIVGALWNKLAHIP
jgi:hypothetical protein